MCLEFQRPAILADGPHDVLWNTLGNLGSDFQVNLHLSPNQPGDVLDDLLGDPASVAAEAGGVEGDGAVEAAGRRRRGRHRDGGASVR